MFTLSRRGFTLVELLIVVIVLGIFATIVIPQFTSASADVQRSDLNAQLQTVRNQIEFYKLQHLDQVPPSLVTGGGASKCWKELLNQTNASGATINPKFGPYLQSAPANPLNGWSDIATTMTDFGTGGQPFRNNGHDGFVVDVNTGKVWATSSRGGFIYNEADSTAVTNDQ